MAIRSKDGRCLPECPKCILFATDSTLQQMSKKIDATIVTAPPCWILTKNIETWTLTFPRQLVRPLAQEAPLPSFWISWIFNVGFSTRLPLFFLTCRQFSISSGLTSFPLVFSIKFGFLEKCKIPSGYKIASGRDHIKFCVLVKKSCVLCLQN